VFHIPLHGDSLISPGQSVDGGLMQTLELELHGVIVESWR
jgi:hypothetical protein